MLVLPELLRTELERLGELLLDLYVVLGLTYEYFDRVVEPVLYEDFVLVVCGLVYVGLYVRTLALLDVEVRVVTVGLAVLVVETGLLVVFELLAVELDEGDTVALVLVERDVIVGRVFATADELRTDVERVALLLMSLELDLFADTDELLTLAELPVLAELVALLLPTILSPVLEELLILLPLATFVALPAVVLEGVLPYPDLLGSYVLELLE